MKENINCLGNEVLCICLCTFHRWGGLIFIVGDFPNWIMILNSIFSSWMITLNSIFHSWRMLILKDQEHLLVVPDWYEKLDRIVIFLQCFNM